MAPLPMFPLGSVLFPHMVLPLHVFEDRYRQLTRDCLAGDRRFGVVLIERGSEVGGGDLRTSIGTVAQIVEAREAEDGRWGVLSIGVSRFRVDAWAEDAPYPRAEVVPLPEEPWSPEAEAAFPAAERAVRRSLALLAELDEPAPPIAVELSESREAAAWQLAAISPLGDLDRQLLLTIAEPAERLRVLTSLTQEECAVLAQRLAGG